MLRQEEIIQRLETAGIPFACFHHEAVFTMEACLSLPFAASDVMYCKNLLLCNRQKTRFYYHMMPAKKPFSTSAVSKALGSSRLSFAEESALLELMGTPSGSLSPFGLWADTGGAVRFSADLDVRSTDRIAFHPCDNTATLIFRQDDFWSSAAPLLCHPVTWLQVPLS